MEIEKLLNAAVDVAKQAGLRLKSVESRTINSDAGNDVKLQEDVDSENFIREKLSQFGIPVIGEELAGDLSLIENKQYYWIVDPIDGTYNFLRKYPGVCVSIALMQGLEPVIGVIYEFTRDELFAGAKGFPLTLNGKIVQPNWAKKIEQAVVMTGFPSSTDYSDEGVKSFIKTVQAFKKVRMCGSAAMAVAYVSSGRADVYVENKVMLWDIAAGLALINSAGGVYKMENANVPNKPLALNVKLASCVEFISDEK